MKRMLLRWLACLLLAGASAASLNAQSFTFSCSRDTLISRCTPSACFTLKGIIPDIHANSGSYTVNTVGNTPSACFPVYVQPDDPGGTSVNLTIDDLYSDIIHIGFPFPFYGTVYNRLIASPNGVVSFDLSNEGDRTHYAILRDGFVLSPSDGEPEDLPSSLYDRALIMGPYHDLAPQYASSPTQRVQCQTVGTAPHRRWILSFYRTPLYYVSGGCSVLIENTHQIVLYESTGIIEVLIFSKQPCTPWNKGRSIIGIQDETRTKALMAPGRSAKDPPWGEPNMQEAYRFVPAGGASLFKRVELYDLGGTFITAGTTTSMGNGKLEASFPNVCPPVGATTTYIIRSVYTKFDNPATEIYGTDTVRVTKSASTELEATSEFTNTNCYIPTGTITITVPPSKANPPYTYVLNGGTPVTGPSPFTISNLPAGDHTVTVTDASGICSSTITRRIEKLNSLIPGIAITATSCAAVNDGVVKVTATNGVGPYVFGLDGFLPQPGAVSYTFTGVSPANHTVFVIDAAGCRSEVIPVDVPVGPGPEALLTQTAAACPAVANGRIRVNAIRGAAPFTYKLDGGSFQPGANPYTFNDVSAGLHTITIRDNAGCVWSKDITVNAGPALLATGIPVATTCDGAGNGQIRVIPLNGTGPYTFSIDGGVPLAVPSPHTFTNLNAGLHTVKVTDVFGCATVDIPVNVAAGPVLTTTYTKANVLCNGQSTGSITIAQPVHGVAPYQYSLNGTTWQSNNVFTGLPANTYTIYYREGLGCHGSQPVTITQPAVLSATMMMTAVVCRNESNGIIAVNPEGGVAPYVFSINNGASWQSSNLFTGLAAGDYTITIRDANNCITTRTATVTQPAVLEANSSNSNASCDGGNDGVINVNATGGNGAYQYSIDGGAHFQAQNRFYVAPGDYTILVKDQLGCSVSFTTSVGLTVNLFLDKMSDPIICNGTSTRLQLVTNGNKYAWSPSTALSSTVVSNPVASPSVNTEYVATVTLGRCTTTDTVMVYVKKEPVPDAGPDGDICYGQSYVLKGNGGLHYNWSPSIYLDRTTGNNPVSTPILTTTYTLSVVDANGCHSLVTDQVTVHVKRIMKVDTYPFDTIAAPGTQFRLRAGSPGITYHWTPSAGLSRTDIADPVVTVGTVIGSETMYQVTATDRDGCKGEGYVKIRIHKGPEIYVPTGFSPNGDGKNDRFTPFPVGIRSYNYFRVFNRWGQVIFSTTRLHEGWDGKIEGKEQPAGVYVWMIEGITESNKTIAKKGTVMLIR